MEYLNLPGSNLEVPGIEAVMEYGDNETYKRDGIPGALRINDRSMPDQVHVTEISGLHDDPDVGDARSESAGRWGERAGILIPRGRTVGITGYVKSNSVGKMRDLWRRMRAQFGRTNLDLIVHPPNEPKFYTNEVSSQSPTGWRGIGDGSVPHTISAPALYTSGTISLTGVDLSASAGTSFSAPYYLEGNKVAWSGEDLWLSAIAFTTGASTNSIAIGARFYDAAGTLVYSWVPGGAGSIASPTTNTAYPLSARFVSSANIVPGAATVAPFIRINTAATGSYNLRVVNVSFVLLDAEDTSPRGAVLGTLPGFEYEGTIGASRAYGPSYVVNQVHDPESKTSALWTNHSNSGTTVQTNNVITNSWPGDGRSSIAFEITNPNTTLRTLAVKSPFASTDPNLYVVAGGRNYRAHARLLVSQIFIEGQLQIVWLDQDLSIISTTDLDSFDRVASGDPALDVEVGGVATAPALSQRAYIRIASDGASAAANDKMKIRIADPRFYDVSEYDPGSVAIDGTQALEHGTLQYRKGITTDTYGITISGARRRIPRPFLLRKVRSVWDGKAPESQRSMFARRDFTMSLRASDPRIYAREERHTHLKMTTSTDTVIFDTTGIINLLPNNAFSFTPFFFTYEGESLPATGTVWRGTSRGALYPRRGMTLAFAEPSDNSHMAQASLARAYYSSGSTTYTTPQVTVAGNVHNGHRFNWGIIEDAYLGTTWQQNYIAAIIKRTASAWIELRFTSGNNALMESTHPGTNPPFSFELWSSHNASGSSGTTRLAGWDIPVSITRDKSLKWVRGYMKDTGVITCELWNQDPNLSDAGLITRRTYTPSGALGAVIGPSIAGRTGWAIRLAQWWDNGTSTGYETLDIQDTWDTPYLTNYESLNYSAANIAMICPVIGDADEVPLKLQLRGDIDSPTIAAFNIDSGEVSTLRLSGVFTESDPVTIDMEAGTITSLSGTDYLDRRLPGSRFFTLSPGVNILSVNSVNANLSSLEHIIATWRDALK